MVAKKSLREHNNILKLLYKTNFSAEILSMVDDYEKQNKTASFVTSRVRTITDIEATNSPKTFDELWSLYTSYFSSKSTKVKLRIRYGAERVVENEEKLRARPRPSSPHSPWQVDFWETRGYSKDEAASIVSDIQRRNSKKRTQESYVTGVMNNPGSRVYWTSRGYTDAEATTLIEPHLQKNDFESMVKRYGTEEGPIRYQNRVERYKKSMEASLKTRTKAGYVSKESKRFFIPLYRKCRKLGVSKNDIYLGLSGSREFFVRKQEFENSGRFVDFCIPKLGIVVEYHGTFWHPRNLEEWSNPFTTFEDAMTKEEELSEVCKQRGLDLYVVWSDDDLKKRSEEIMSVIEERYYARGHSEYPAL